MIFSYEVKNIEVVVHLKGGGVSTRTISLEQFEKLEGQLVDIIDIQWIREDGSVPETPPEEEKRTQQIAGGDKGKAMHRLTFMILTDDNDLYPCNPVNWPAIPRIGEKVGLYAPELTGYDGKAITGTVFDVGYSTSDVTGTEFMTRVFLRDIKIRRGE